MENQQWISKSGEAVAMDLVEKTTDDYSDADNGIAALLKAETDGNAEKHGILDKMNRNAKIEQVVEAAVSEMSKKTIESILEQVKSLSSTEHLLLYLKLPTECNNIGDPLRQPLNPLGSRSEISQTIMWIKTHLEEDPELSLPKQDVYNEYYAFCAPNKIKPLSTADFGKVMKQVYPKVRPRRLGTRGNSRYCYAGLRRRLKLDSPLLPDLSDKPQSSELPCTSTDLLAAAWMIVKEWSEHQLRVQFSSLQALACYLVLNLSVGSGSEAAHIVTSTAKSAFKAGDSLPAGVCNSKHREAQLQLQRKIQQKSELNREQKRKIQLQSPKVEQKIRNKKCKLQGHSTSSSLNPSPTTPTTNDINASPSIGLQTVCDKPTDFTNVQALPDFSSFHRAVPVEDASEYANEMIKPGENVSDVPKPNVVGKLPIPRIGNFNKLPPVSSPKRGNEAKYKAIQPKPEPCDIAYNMQPSAESFRSHNIKCENALKSDTDKAEIDNITTTLVDGSDISLPRERLISIGDIDKSALDDYLGAGNSQEHEEELVKYFQNKDKEDDSTKLTQLRQILINQQNLEFMQNVQFNSTSQENGNANLLGSVASAFTKTNRKQMPNVLQTLQKVNESSARRRVSFEVLQDDTVPPSPNTRRKNFNFTPISPGPLSPTGRQSKCSSATVSPFVSPRNTPVPRSKSLYYPHCNIATMSVNLTSPRKPLTNLKIKQETDTHNENGKPIIGTEEGQDQLTVATDVPNYLPMSAPVSPKLPIKGKNSNLLQKLLNSNNKVFYQPNYVRSQSSSGTAHDSLSTEISQLFSSSPQVNLENSYRSQSVPLHQMSLTTNENIQSPLIQNSFNTQFPFNTSMQGEFNDFDSFSANENINVNKILNTLESCPSDVDMQNSESATGIADLNKNFVGDDFKTTFNRPTISRTPMLPNLRSLGRSQSIDVEIRSDINYSMKYNPSRSVPGTPVPCASNKIDFTKNCRSYPSTPLAVNETFSYNHSHDYLLNGQPIKEKVTAEINQNLPFFQNLENSDEVVYNADLFNINDTNLNCDILMEDKNNFSFDNQMSDSAFCSKQNINSIAADNCNGDDVEFDFTKNTAGGS